MQGSPFVLAVLFSYVILGAFIVASNRGIRGIMAAVVIGWLFLPPARGINLPGIPMFTKEFSVAYALLLGVLISDSAKLIRFRPNLIDLPMLIFILAPFPTSITNGLGVYDGMSESYSNFFLFGFPYLLGRVYIQSPSDVKVVAKWFILAGLIAVPFALWESRMSPQLNKQLYGYQAASFRMTMRLGGYRPMLFMRHGLEVGLWFATSGAVAMWLWLVAPKHFKLFNTSIPVFFVIIFGTTILSRSLGAIFLLLGTTTVGILARSFGLRIALILLVLTPSIYLTVRISNVWSPDQITSLISSFDADRAQSLQARLNQEVDFSKHALRRPLWGWGRYGRDRPNEVDAEGSVVDGLTTIIFGVNGFVGLISYVLMVSLPSLLLIIRLKGGAILSPIWAPAIGISLGIAIFSIDMMFNSFFTPMHIIGVGVIASVAVQAKQWQRTILNHQYQSRSANAKLSPTQSKSTDQSSLASSYSRNPRGAS